MIVATGEACPISGQKVSSTAGRLNGVVTFFLLAASMLGAPWLLFFLLLDFGIKVSVGFRYSPICWLTRTFTKALKLPTHMVDVAPKRFAAMLGLAFVMGGILFAYVVPVPLAFYLFVGGCAACAALEGFAGFCLGCWIYQHLPHRA